MLNEAKITLKIQKHSRTLAVYLGTVVCFTGIMVLLGWQFDVDFFKRLVPSFVAMNPATAISFILLGAAIILINKTGGHKNLSLLSNIIVLLVFLISTSCLVTNIFEISNGFDQWFFKEKLEHEAINIDNRMAPNTAFSLIISCISFFLLQFSKESTNKTSQSLALLTAFISLLSIIGYIYGVRAFYGVLTYIPMALNTAFCFLLISGSILLSTFDKSIIASFTNNYMGSVIARKLIPAIIVIPVVLGFIIIAGEKRGIYTEHFGAALFTVANILIFLYLIRKIQTSVNKADMGRTAAENKLKETNTKLTENAQTLKILNTELEAFSYSISHDLKTPLIAIEGFANLLEEDYKVVLGKEGRENLNAIINGATKMRTLIDDLLEFSHTQRKELQSAPCSMENLVKKVLKDQQMSLSKKKYEINVSSLYDCLGDNTMLEQVWANLISNAIKYSSKKEKPHIEIGSYKDNKEITYFIKDNGDGFDMKNNDKLFLVFQRFHTQNEFEGTGIGLAIVHKIISRHGGRIWAEAKKHEGASFYFSLPIIVQ